MTNRSADIGVSGVTSIMGGEQYRPYPAYKDSGTEWLGEIPAHWEVKRLRFTVTKCQNGLWGDDPDGLNDVVCIRVAEFDRVAYEVKISQPTLRSVASMILSTRGLRCGDLLLEKSGGGDNQPVGVVVLNTYSEPAVCSNFIARMPVQEGFDPRHLTYLHAALYAARINTRSIKQNTGIQNLDSKSYLNEVAAFPEILEQRAIAAFLDRETAKIDALVAKKERLIELLQEKRTALISDAVTKGLDPDAPLKDFGVEWLGEIPAHWEVRRLRTLADIKTGGRDTVDQQEEGKYPFFVRSQTVERINTWSFDGEAVLTAGDGVGVGKVFHYVNGKFDYHQRVYKFSNFRGVMGRFFFYFFKEMLRFEVLQGTAKSTVDSLRLPMLQNFPVVVLPLSEQRAIVSFLDRETAKIDAIGAKVQEAIDRLKELRTALISAAVTGKIDVREAAA